MIYNWDIISRLEETASGNQHFLLVIDGSERDAHLITKKLSGYVGEPMPAEEPFAYAFELPLNADESTLEKIRTAVREAIDQIHKINQFAPGASLGSPLFTDQESAEESFIDLSRRSSENANSDSERTENSAPSILRQALSNSKSSPSQEAETSSPPLNISDKDMLIKDMENTLLGKMPEEDLLSENTKLEVFNHAEETGSAVSSSQKRAEKLNELAADEQAPSEDSFNPFENQLEDQEVELEELKTVTDTITEKDLEFVKHAQTDPNFSLQLAKQTHAPAKVQATQKVTSGPSLSHESKHTSSEREPIDLPEITIRGQKMDPLEKTFNLETTLTTEVMRAQYEKSIRKETPSTDHPKNEPAKPIMHPAQTMLHATHLKGESGQPSSTNKTGEHPMEEHAEEKTFFRIRRKQQQNAPHAPQTPHAPNTPQAPQMPQMSASIGSPESHSEVTMPSLPGAPAPKPAPTPTPATSPVRAEIDNGAEKTKTIDHSIELPSSELKKHNWPLEVPLLPTYTLENMVLSGNRFAQATAISVMENPGKLYNPLVFHGTTGTGKTHFLNAMAYGFSKKYGQENVFMTNGVRFSRGIQRYVVEGNIEKFETFMQSVKVLLIDDIHLLAVNEQNRAYISKIFHTFLKNQKQIVITSKYPPESLEKLEDLINFRLDSGWISELKPATGSTHFKIVKKMLLSNDVDLSDAQITQFFGNTHVTLSTVMRNIRRLRVLENLVFPNLPENERSQANMFEKLLATAGEDPNSELLTRDPVSVSSITTSGNNEWGRIGFFYPSHSADSLTWMVYALQQRAKELGIPGGFELAVRSSYSTENIISSAFKIANLCDNKKLRGAVILGPALNVCEPSVRENFYDILTHMLEIMLIRCGIINTETLRLPSTYVKVISELLR